MVKEIRSMRFDILVGANKDKRRELTRIIHDAGVKQYEILHTNTKDCVCRCYGVDSEVYEVLIFYLRASKRYWTVVWN